MTTIQVAEIAAGILLLLWAFAKRRSPVDSIPLTLAALLLLLLGLEWDSLLRFRTFYMFPEAMLGLLGILLVVLAFVSRGRHDQTPGAIGNGPAAVGGGALPRSIAADVPRDQRQPASRFHRIGIGVVGCVIMIPLLLLLALVLAFMIGSGHDRSPAGTPVVSNGQ